LSLLDTRFAIAETLTPGPAPVKEIAREWGVFGRCDDFRGAVMEFPLRIGRCGSGGDSGLT